MYFPLARHDGYCVRCDDERPLVVMERGERGLRAWLAGVGPEDRSLSYTCLVCGAVEHVPLTEAEDAEYDSTLPTWPDWAPFLAPALEPVATVLPDAEVFAAAVARLSSPEPVVEVSLRPRVRVMTIPVQRVAATDERLLAVAG